MTQQSPNQQDFEQLVDNYVMHIIDGLDYKDMEQMLFDLLQREYEKMTWDDVTEEIVDLYDEDTLIDLIPVDNDNKWLSLTYTNPQRIIIIE